jgi:hypothetical protein
MNEEIKPTIFSSAWKRPIIDAAADIPSILIGRSVEDIKMSQRAEIDKHLLSKDLRGVAEHVLKLSKKPSVKLHLSIRNQSSDPF